MTKPAPARSKVLALSGGIGGAKLALGLHRVLGSGELTVAVNTGDDFVHLGLHVSPDIDTIVYTLSGLSDPEKGWGRVGETWNFMKAITQLGGESWFNLGDADLAMHIQRTHRLGSGESLTRITRTIAERLGISGPILPMSDDPVRTRLLTAEGWLDFQDYFVRRKCEPFVEAVAYAGAETATANAELLSLLADPALRAVALCPSNPFLSIDPMLALPALRAALGQTRAPVVAVSPIIAGESIKGPTAKMMRELGLAVTASAVAERYADFIDVFVVDDADADCALPRGVERVVAPTLMRDLADRERLARVVLAAGDASRRRKSGKRA